MYAHPLLALLADSAYEPLILLDEQHRVVAANQAARSLMPNAAIVGGRIESLIDSPDLADLLDCVTQHSQCPEAQFALGQNLFRARCTRVTHKDAVYFTLSMQDITQLLRLNRARRDMVANISHELRTPISAIRLLRDTLARQHVGKKQRQKVLRKIGRELDTLQRIVDGMHDLSMIESGQAIMKLIEMPLIILVEEALEHLDEQIEQRDLKINVDVPATLYVLVDRAQIGRVLANLIHNAIKVTPKKSKIQVTAQADINGETITVHVDDSGPGIPADERDRIFERFYQIDGARSQGRGSGLGLSISRHIIEAHNGQIWVEASELGGARFCFTLLAADPREEAV
jgi:two-component system phosphate regulon sensor histidine kinase PhoR